MIPRVKDRHIYTLLYPFAYHGHFEIVRETLKSHVIEPLSHDWYAKMGYPNNYSMFVMAYGAGFYTPYNDPKSGKLIKFHSLGMLKALLLEQKEEFLENADAGTIISILYTFALHN